MVNKLPLPPTPNEIVGKINEVIDDKQDTLVSGTNIKTINNQSLLGSGNIDIQGGGSSYTAGTGIDITNNEISVTSAISNGATGNVKLNGGSSSQTISLTSGTGTTALAVKSMSSSSYISFSGSSGWLASFGIGSDKKPTIYDGSSHTIAYTSDIPTNNNQLTNGAGFITSSALSGYQTTSNLVTSVSSSSTDSQYPSAKLFYDTVGDIETLINAL